jgi:exosome complex component RRP4
MAITILAPASAAPAYNRDVDSDEDFEDGGVDLEGDVDMDSHPSKRAKLSAKDIVTPGETVTDDPQWMR